jgi:hypothetical protein
MRMSSSNRVDEIPKLFPRLAVPTTVNVVIHAPEAFEDCIENPLGTDRAPHTIWTWADGSWLLVRFCDDGQTVAVTSPGISAMLVDHENCLLVRVDPVVHRSAEDHSGSPLL